MPSRTRPAGRSLKPLLPAIRRLRPADGQAFLRLINALADYEKLPRPGRSARARLLRDAFGRHRRFDAYLLRVARTPIGYAIVYQTYSSFLARPTLYLEDLFILPAYRGQGFGETLFTFCRNEAERRQCGRMEWTVLDWNKPAIDFYNRRGAQHMNEWLLYRISF